MGTVPKLRDSQNYYKLGKSQTQRTSELQKPKDCLRRVLRQASDSLLKHRVELGTERRHPFGKLTHLNGLTDKVLPSSFARLRFRVDATPSSRITW